jgi:hypothetical protein
MCFIREQVYWSFFFVEQTITGTASLGLTEMRLMPQPEKDRSNTFFFQQDGAPPNFHRNVT